ncbi:hypothetical protein GGR59_000365 [Xanthomonas arboricola]|uniref:hypothetical protein n=1 Tax=Xanthomonas arboricola TaxID=56448 RepID=UPI001614417F|nr:hypothetical protein [Xanthomonas arboricola]MBB4604160.1 hypothetical protein [Xanthomonas arboricola]
MSRHNAPSLSELVAQAHAARGRMLALEAVRVSCPLHAAALIAAATIECLLSAHDAKEQRHV